MGCVSPEGGDTIICGSGGMTLKKLPSKWCILKCFAVKTANWPTSLIIQQGKHCKYFVKLVLRRHSYKPSVSCANRKVRECLSIWTFSAVYRTAAVPLLVAAKQRETTVQLIMTIHDVTANVNTTMTVCIRLPKHFTKYILCTFSFLILW